MIVYKVGVRSHKKKLVSPWAEGARITYTPEEWIHHSHIFVFSSLEATKGHWRGGYEVWECEAEEVHECPRRIPVLERVPGHAQDNSAFFWDDPEEWLRLHTSFQIQSPPSGTILCDRLKLIKKVW